MARPVTSPLFVQMQSSVPPIGLSYLLKGPRCLIKNRKNPTLDCYFSSCNSRIRASITAFSQMEKRWPVIGHIVKES
jgi:hypothetical protein